MNTMNNFLWMLHCALAMACVVGPSTAAPIAVVPGSVAGYLYLPATNASASNTVTVNFIKEGSFTQYSISSTPSGLVCGNDVARCTGQLVTGTAYEFKVTGQYASDLHVLPTWSEGCAATENVTCSTVVSAAITIKVAAAALVEPLTPVLVAGKVKARYLYQISDGAYLVGATEHLLRGKPWQSASATTGATNTADGRKNMSKITNSDHVNHCQGGLSTEMGGDWYWPAKDEIDSIDAAAWMRVVNLKELWSSTEAGGSKAYKRNLEKPETKSEDKSKTERNGLCVKRF